MKEEKKDERLSLFWEWISSIPIKDFDRIKARVLSECLITRQTFHYWYTKSNVPSLARRNKIDEIALDEGYEKVYNKNDVQK